METKRDWKEQRAVGPTARATRLLPIASISPDENNRHIDEADEEFLALVDSVRVFGVLQAIHVIDRKNGYEIIDGERRWRAARVVGLSEVPCEVWPAEAAARDALVAGIAINQHRQAHRCIHVARRLRDIKNSEGLTCEELAERTGLPLHRVKAYLGLFGGSDFLLDFFEKNDVPITVAAEFVRYEKAAKEAKARALATRYIESPFGEEFITRLRKREGDKPAPRDSTHKTSERGPRGVDLGAVVERAWRKDPERARERLTAALERLGYRLVALDGGRAA